MATCAGTAFALAPDAASAGTGAAPLAASAGLAAAFFVAVAGPGGAASAAFSSSLSGATGDGVSLRSTIT